MSDYDGKEDNDKYISDNGSNGFEIDKDDNDKIDIPVAFSLPESDSYVNVGAFKSENPYLIDFPDALNQKKPVFDEDKEYDQMPVVIPPDNKSSDMLLVNNQP